LNLAENDRPASTVDATIAGIDAVHSDDYEGWANGSHLPDREAARKAERVLYEALTDYHRTFDRVIIDPPFASVAWTIIGTIQSAHIEVQGCSNVELGRRCADPSLLALLRSRGVHASLTDLASPSQVGITYT
jgi:hypothetical protein